MAGSVDAESKTPEASPFGFVDAAVSAASRFSGRDRLLGLTLLLVVLGASAWFVFNGDPSRSERPDVFGGSVVIRHRPDRDPVVVDVAAKRPTVQLQLLGQNAGGDKTDDAQLLPSSEGYYLLNPKTGAVNLLGRENSIVNRVVQGGLQPFVGEGEGESSTYAGIASDAGTYLVRVLNGKSQFVLINRNTVVSATKEDPNVKPIGAIEELGTALTDPESSRNVDPRRRRLRGAPLGSALYVLIEQGTDTRVLKLSPPPPGDASNTPKEAARPPLREEWVMTVSKDSVLVSGPGIVAVADPTNGTLTTLSAGPNPGQSAPALRDAKALLPVIQSNSGAWVAALSADGEWRIVGTPSPSPATPLTLPLSSTEIAPPVVADGWAYSVSRQNGSIARVNLTTAANGMVDNNQYRFEDDPNSDKRFADAVVEARGALVLANPPASKIARIGAGPDSWTDLDKTSARGINPLNEPEAISDAKKTSTTASASSVPGAAPTTLPQNPKPTVILKPGCENTDQVPYKPVNLEAKSVTNRTITVVWDYKIKSADDCEVSSWDVKSRERGTTDWTSHSLTSTTKQFEVAGLKSDTVYEFVVQARLGKQEKESDTLTSKTGDTEPPVAPSNVVATSTEGVLKVDWTPGCTISCDPAIREYAVVLKSADVIGPPPKTVTTVAAASPLSATLPITPELVGKRLQFTVTAKSAKTAAPEVLSNVVEGWRKPDFNLISVTASPPAPDGATQKTTVQITPKGAVPELAFGASSPTFVFHLGNQTSGTGTAPQTEFKGLPNNTTMEYWVEVVHHETRWPQEARGELRFDYQPWKPPTFQASLDEVSPPSNSGTITIRTTSVPDNLGTAFSVDQTTTCGPGGGLSSTSILAPELKFNTPNGVLVDQSSCLITVTLTETSAPKKYDPSKVQTPISVPVPFPPANPIQSPLGQAFFDSNMKAEWDPTDRNKINLFPPPNPAWGQWKYCGKIEPRPIQTSDTSCVTQRGNDFVLNASGKYFGVERPFTYELKSDNRAMTKPGAPIGVSGVAGIGYVDVTWSAPASDGGATIRKYTVTANPGPEKCTSTNGTTCRVTGLTNGTPYTFTVVATNGNGDGPASAASAPVTPQGPSTTTSTTSPPCSPTPCLVGNASSMESSQLPDPGVSAPLGGIIFLVPIAVAGTTSLSVRRRKELR